jgi:LacI family transcriptional regulator
MAAIARACGVSRPAVSMALAGKPGEVSDDTRARILATAARLGYRPNAGALAVRTGRFQALALLLDRASYLPQELLLALNHACSTRGLHLVVADATADDLLAGEKSTSQTKILDHLLADGLLINWGVTPAPELRTRLAAGPLPLRWLNQRLGGNCIHPDDHAASAALVAGLVALGHRRIAFSGLLGSSNDHYSWPDRLAGYRDSMRAHGLPELLHHADGAIADGAGRIAAARTFLAQPDRPTAVICYSAVAMYAYHLAARDLGLRVPVDLSLAGHIESHHRDVTGLALGGVAVPWAGVAEAAVAALSGAALSEAAPEASDLAIAPSVFQSADTCARSPA